MSKRRSFLLENTDKKLRISNIIIKVILFILIAFVIFDSYNYNIPFYYVLFIFVGILIGKIYKLSHKVDFDDQTLKSSLFTNKWSIVFLISLLSFRFFLGQKMFQFFGFESSIDALYLLFIGIYYSKWKVIISQLDDNYYSLFKKNDAN